MDMASSPFLTGIICISILHLPVKTIGAQVIFNEAISTPLHSFVVRPSAPICTRNRAAIQPNKPQPEPSSTVYLNLDCLSKLICFPYPDISERPGCRSPSETFQSRRPAQAGYPLQKYQEQRGK